MKLRLLLFEDCHRNCAGCCNKDWNLGTLPICDSFTGYEEILLTGGEPMLSPRLVHDVITDIREETSLEQDQPQIYLYTADVRRLADIIELLDRLDGITVTLHSQNDVLPWIRLADIVATNGMCVRKSLRLNVFDGVVLEETKATKYWKIKSGMRWITNCPLPENEIFMRLM